MYILVKNKKTGKEKVITSEEEQNYPENDFFLTPIDKEMAENYQKNDNCDYL